MSYPLFQLTSLNLNGVRSAVSKGLQAWVEQTQPDCMCVQELKAQELDLKKTGLIDLAGMSGYFQFAKKKGYSGVGIYSRHTPSDVVEGWDQGEFDAEGRYLELRFDSFKRKLSIISAYFPSGSSGDERQQAKYRFLTAFYPWLRALQKERDFILCADINIAHQNIDLKNWRSNQKNSGFLPQERQWLSKLLCEPNTQETQLVDVYRLLEPETREDCYTWWSNRGQAYVNNVGWRLDYQLATPALAELARNVHIYKKQKFSDHAPITFGYDFRL